AFDRVTRLVGKLLKTPIVLVSLVDEQRLWFKSHLGVDVTEAPRAGSFCSQAILGEDIFLVPDAKRDKRFASHPWVAGPPGIRFYAGMPLRVPSGHNLGTLCAVDTVPRELSEAEAEALRDLGALVVDALTVRLAAATDRQRMEGKFDALFELSPDGSLLVNGQGIVARANPRAEALFGYTAGQMAGRSVEQLLPLTARGGLLALRPDAAREFDSGRTPLEQAVLFATRRDGSQFPVEISVSRLPAADGVQVLVAVRDITLRRQGEEELRHSEARLNEAQRIAQVASWEHELSQPHTVWSAEMFRVTELDPAATVPSRQAFQQLVHPDDWQRVMAEHERTLAAHEPYDLVHRLLMPDGRVKHVRARINIDYGPDGKPVRYAGTVQDVTQRIAAELELQQQRNLLQTVMDTIPDMLFLKDLEGRYLVVNQAMAEFFGKPADWFIGKTNRELPYQDADFHALSISNDREVLETRSPVVSGETQMTDAAGVQHWRQVTKLPWRNAQGQLVGVVGMNHDITGRK
ncbi:MAG TPA: PAS domain S-box protein, partial [bacterium]|nr:PAS domain S-box protein [bacterium]